MLTSQPSAEMALRQPRSTIMMPMLACRPCSQNSSGYLHIEKAMRLSLLLDKSCTAPPLNAEHRAQKS